MLTRIYSILYQVTKIVYYRLHYRKLFQYGNNLRFRDTLRINIVGGKVIIGNNNFFNHDCTLNSHCSIKVGHDCLFGENVKIYDHNHKFRVKEIPINNQGYTCAEVVIGDNCWIGSNVTILKGVHIGNHVVIGAGCTITKDIPEDSIVHAVQNMMIEVMD
jgi:acetyltransferase-like isoleucine patch superfamily enzyme